ncbi:MAG: cache domain-containing protein [Spirochaetales bacterium]|nr:cache domain-containing protein [Spirochaetales bacterium]
MKHVSDKVDLIQYIRKVTIIIFAIGMFCFAAVGLFDQFTLVKSKIERIRSGYIDKQKQIVKTQVENTVLFINLAKKTGISREDIIETVRKIKFDKEHDGYIFIVTYDGEALLIDPQRHLEGENIWDITDPNGVKIVQEERRAVQNPNPEKILLRQYQPSTAVVTSKVSFMKGVPEWEWMVGSGVYLDSVEKDIAILQRDQSPLGYVEYDLEFNIVYWNPAAERIFEYSREEILGRSDDIIIPPEILPEIKDLFKVLIDESTLNKEGIKSINDNITKSGRRITCEWYNKALTDQNGKVIGVIALVDDITDRKLIEDRLQKSLEEKKILLKEVHHRVKNNMAIISSFLSLQSMKSKDEYVRSLLLSSENRVQSMALIHENLYKSESLKDINVKIYIYELLMTLLDSYGYGADDISTKTEITQCELELDILIPLGMLINEIISNALKHAFYNVDSPELSISLIKGKVNEIILTINDNGIGLPEESEINHNDSIGFMLIDGLAQQINSKMEIRRENGTEFKITIPV